MWCSATPFDGRESKDQQRTTWQSGKTDTTTAMTPKQRKQRLQAKEVARIRRTRHFRKRKPSRTELWLTRGHRYTLRIYRKAISINIWAYLCHGIITDL
jgi:hypothetical protein